MGIPACTHCLAMGHQLRGRDWVSRTLTLFIALGVSFNHPHGQAALVQLSDPVPEQQRQRHPVLHPGKGHQVPLYWGGGAPSPSESPAVEICKVLATVKAFQ